MTGPSDPAEVRRNNLALVLRAIAARDSVSRTTLRATTGLVSTSVSTLVDDLLARGLVLDDGASAPTGPGRPRRQVRLNSKRVVTTTVHLTRLEITGEIRDFSGEVLWQQRSKPAIRRGVTDDLVDAIASMLDDAQQVAAALPGAWAHPPVVALPGPVIDQRVSAGIPVFRIDQFDLVEALGRRRPGHPETIVVNVGRLAAYGEYAAMPPEQRPQSVAYFATGTESLMGGLVMDGAVYLGSHSMAGETGHVSVSLDGARCICGLNGCLETYLGLPYLLPNAGMENYAERGSIDEAMDALIALLKERDDRAVAAVERAGAALATAIGSVGGLLDVELIILGGAIARLAPWLTPAIDEFLDARSAVVPGCIPRLQLASVGRDAPRIGAWRLARQEILDDPSQIPIMDAKGDPIHPHHQPANRSSR